MRHLLLFLAIAAALVAPLAGCGESSDETTAPAPIDAGEISAQELRADWERNPECERPKGASRWGCSVDSFRCQGVVTGRGWTISCAKPGQSVAFRVQPE